MKRKQGDFNGRWDHEEKAARNSDSGVNIGTNNAPIG